MPMSSRCFTGPVLLGMPQRVVLSHRKALANGSAAIVFLASLSPVPGSFGQESKPIHIKVNDLSISCKAEKETITLGETVKITLTAKGTGLIYSFGASAGTLIVTENTAILNTAGILKAEQPIKVMCGVIDLEERVAQSSTDIAIAGPPIPIDASITDVKLKKVTPPDGYQFSTTVAPSLSWTTGTQTQTISGGSLLLSGVKSKSFCDPDMRQLGLAANASNTKTTKAGKTSNIDNNEVRVSGTLAAFPREDKLDKKEYANIYLGAGTDFFDNNLLGIGLQQTYTGQAQFYFRRCRDKDPTSKPDDKPSPRWFYSVGVGAGYMNQRLYGTQNKLNVAVLPLTAQVSYLQSNSRGIPPKLIWYALVGYMPVLNDLHAYQIGAAAGLQVPTKIQWLTFTLSETDLYMNNAPPTFKRNYQNGTVSAVITFPKPPAKIANPALPAASKGACYGGDKLARLFCYDDVTADACAPPNMFRATQHCPSAGTGAIPQVNTKLDLQKETRE
jgi:hypothetical protein